MMIIRAALAVAFALGVLAAPLAAEAQQAREVPRIGFLGGGRGGTPDGEYLIEAFRKGLRDLGWVEGQSIVVEWRYTRGRDEKAPDLAAELVRLRVQVIVVGGADPVVRAAKAATSSIPIVMAVSTDPVRTRLVASLARPGGNVTGLSINDVEVAGKRLELLREAVPRASRVAVLWNAAHPGKDLELAATQSAAKALGVTLRPVAVRGAGDFDAAFAAIGRERPDALIAFSEPLVLAHRQRIIDFSIRARLPLIAGIKEFTEAGAFMTYGASLPDLFRHAASFVDKILKGAKPADLPVEQPTKFELVINLKTAKALGLTIPHSVLLRADQIIE